MCLHFYVISTSPQIQPQKSVIEKSRYNLTVNPYSENTVPLYKDYAFVSGLNSSNTDHLSSFNLTQRSAQYHFLSIAKFDSAMVMPTILISGSVTDYHGQPIAAAVIKPDGKPNGVRTNDAGRYQLRVEFLEGHYPTLIFLKSGYKKKMIRIVESDLFSKSSISVDMKMEYSSETITVNGWLGETTGANIQAQVIKLISLRETLQYSAISDESGNFSFEGIKRDVEYKVDIKSSENYKRKILENIKITELTSPLYITLESVELVNIEGMVVDRHGGAVRNLSFKLRSDANSIYDTDLKTDDYGRFELQNFPMGDLLFTTQAPKFFKVTGIDLSQIISTDIVIPIDVGPHRISGWISDQHGRPLQGARAILDADFKYNGLNSSSIRTYVTDETGYFEFSSLGPGEHYVTVYAKGYINQGASYDTSTQFDPLYLQLSQWGESMISSESLKLKQLENANQAELIVY